MRSLIELCGGDRVDFCECKQTIIGYAWRPVGVNNL